MSSNIVEEEDGIRRYPISLPDGREGMLVSLPKETRVGIPSYKGNNAPKNDGVCRRPINLQYGTVTLPVTINIGECDEELLTERRREMDYHLELDVLEGEQQ